MYNSNTFWSSFRFKMFRKSGSAFLEKLFSHFDQISGGCSRADIEESRSTWVDFFTFTFLLELNDEKVKTFTFYFSSSQFRQSLGILCIGQMTSLAEAVSRTSC